jgi:hypothetical protein
MANNAKSVAGLGRALPPFSTMFKNRENKEVLELVVILASLLNKSQIFWELIPNSGNKNSKIHEIINNIQPGVFNQENGFQTETVYRPEGPERPARIRKMNRF